LSNSFRNSEKIRSSATLDSSEYVENKLELFKVSYWEM